VPRAHWTYELPPIGGNAVGIEDYAVESSDGDRDELLRHVGDPRRRRVALIFYRSLRRPYDSSPRS
jgi:hypothetical protein